MEGQSSDAGGLSEGTYAKVILLSTLLFLLVILPRNLDFCSSSHHWGWPLAADSSVDWMSNGCDLSSAKETVAYSPIWLTIFADLTLVCLLLALWRLLRPVPLAKASLALAVGIIVSLLVTSLIFMEMPQSIGCGGSTLLATVFKGGVTPQLAGSGINGDGSVILVFSNNGVGSPIEVIGGSVKDPKAKFCCELQYPINSMQTSASISPGDSFLLTGGPACIKPGNEDEAFQAIVCVDYRAQGETRPIHECGTLRGGYE